MNTVYRLIWNATLGAWVVASEFATSRRKSMRGRNRMATGSVAASICIGGSLLLATSIPNAAVAQALPPLIVSDSVTEDGVTRDSPATPAVTVIGGGDYAGTGVILTSQAPSSGGNQGAVFVLDGGHASFDATSTITMQSTSAATTCCTYGIVAMSAGSTVDTAATVTGSTGGAGAYDGSRINLNGGSLSGLFGIVSSGSGSLITGTADISGSGAGTGVRAELGGHVNLLGGRVLANGMTATDVGSVITTAGVRITGAVNAQNGATVSLDGGSVTAAGFGVFGVSASGSVPSQVTTSADITSFGGGGGGAVAARNGSRVDIIGGNLSGSIVAAGIGSVVNFQNATLTQSAAQGSVGVYADNGGLVNLNGGTVLAPGHNNVTALVTGSGSIIRNDGATIIGTPGSSVGARAEQGGTFILGAGGSLISSGTAVQALNAGIIESLGTISAIERAAHASGAGSTVTISGGSLATTGYVANVAAIMADTSGVVNVATAGLLDSASFAGNGVLAQSGGMVNLAGGTLTVTRANAAALILFDAGSAINSSAPLTALATGASGKALILANGASGAYTGLTALANGTNGVAVSSVGAGNQLSVSSSLLSGTQLLKDDGNAVELIALGSSTLEGTTAAAASSLSVGDSSVWRAGPGQSSIGTLILDDGTLAFQGTAKVQVSNSLAFGAAGGTIDTRGFDATIDGGWIIGVGDLAKIGTGVLTLANGIDFSGNTTVADGTLRIGDGGATGTVAFGQVLNDAELVFNRSDVVTVDFIAGNGDVRQEGTGTTILLGDNIYAGQTLVEAGTLQLGMGGGNGSIAGAVEISDTGMLSVRRSNAVILDNPLTGSGILDVDTQGETFDFGSNTGSSFAGTVVLGDTSFRLGELNTVALEGATLRADLGSQVSVADGIQSIHGLSIQGGSLSFNASVPDQLVATSTIKTGLLDATGSGTIVVDVPVPYNIAAPDTDNASNLLTQDDGNIGTRLVEADAVHGSGGGLVLVDQDGSTLSDSRNLDIAQGGGVVAHGTYNYRLTTASGDGLYVNYGLVALELADGQSLTLTPDAGASVSASDMSARISGQGNLAIEAGAGSVSLSNATNDYTGATLVSSGILRLDADNALGRTRLLELESGTSADINGTAQAIGAIDLQSDSMLDLGGGSLTLDNGGRSTGALTGEGNVTIIAGKLDILGDNAGLAATVGILEGATVQLDSAAGLGSGDIANDGLLTFNGVSDEQAFSNSLNGSGAVFLNGQSSIAVTGDNSGYSGKFEIGAGSTLIAVDARNLGVAAIIDDGDLIIANASDWLLANTVSGAGNVTKQGAGVLSVVNGLTHGGSTTVSEGILRAGQAGVLSQNSNHVVSAGASLDTSGFDQIIVGLNNAGVVNLAGETAGATLTVTGNYVGSDGRLVIGAALGGDGSTTDRLMVQGDTAGSTRVSVINMGGAGDTTENGIKIIGVDGASNGTFELEGRAVAGAYEYSLKQGGKLTPADGNWYLRSEADDLVEPVLRPEPAAYLGNQQAAVRMFRHGLHDRAGEPGFGAAAGDGQGGSSWVRLQSNQLSASTMAHQVNTDTRADTIQVGGDVQFGIGAGGRIHLGAMGGHGRATTNGVSTVSEHSSQGKVEGNSLGLYGTWYQNATGGTGLYVDVWAQYARFDNTVEGDSLAREDYRSRTISGSLEAGYAIRLRSKDGVSLYLEPQLQVIHADFDGDDVAEQNGTAVNRMDAGGTTTRIGARLYTRPIGHDHNRVQPFVAANWWSGGNTAGVAMDGEYLRRDLPKDVFEVKAGAQLEFGYGWTGWGQLSHQSGSYGFKDVSAQVGIKLNW